jgi:hypothetical protein
MTKTVAFHLFNVPLARLLFVRSDARALFERVITTFGPERARPLWERWARYEYQYGDLEAAQKLEKRIAEVYPSGMFATLGSGHDAHGSIKIHPSNGLLNDTHTLELMPLQREISVFRWQPVTLPLLPARLLLRNVQILCCLCRQLHTCQPISHPQRGPHLRTTRDARIL